jgi:hypothetical protein
VLRQRASERANTSTGEISAACMLAADKRRVSTEMIIKAKTRETDDHVRNVSTRGERQESASIMIDLHLSMSDLVQKYIDNNLAS